MAKGSRETVMEEYERIAKRQYDRMNAKSPVPKGYESQIYEKLRKKAYETYVVPFDAMVSRQENVRPETLQSLLDASKEDKSRRLEVGARLGMDEKAIGGLGETPELKAAKTNAKLESMGVDISRKTPIESWKVGLAETPEIGLQRLLSDYYKVQVPVKKIEGEYVYQDPTDGRLVKADIGGAAGFLAATPDIADVAATIAMPAKSLVTSPIKKEMGVSAVASGIVELARLSFGNVVGANNLDASEIISLAAKKGGVNSMLTGLGGGAYKLVKSIQRFFKGGVFTHEEAARHGIATEYANDVVEEANRISKQVSDGAEFNPTAYQRTAAKSAGDINIGAMESDIRKRGEFGQDFVDNDYANQKALGNTIKAMNKPEITPLIDKGDITDIAQKEMSAIVVGAEKELKSDIVKSTVAIKKYEGVPYDQVGESTKAFITQADKVAKGKEVAEWTKVKEIGGYDPVKHKFNIEIPEGENTRFLKRQLAEQSGESLTQAGKKASGDIFVGGKRKPQDLEYVNAEISALKAEVRSKSSNQAFTDSQKRQVNRVIDAIETDRNIYLTKTGRGDLIEQINKAEEATRKYHETFDRSKIGDLLSVNKNGVPKIKTNEYVDSILKGDIVEAQQLKSVIDKDPTAKLEFRQGIANKYTRSVYGKNGKFNRKKSDEFFNNPVISEFFTKAEIKGFKRRGDFAEKVQSQIIRLNNFKKIAEKRFGTAVLAKTDSRSLVKNILGDSKLFRLGAKERKDAVTKVKYIKNMYADHPQALTQFKNEYNKQVTERLLDTDELVKPGSLEKMVNDSKMMELASEINGKQYVKNLRAMNDMSKIISKKAKALSSDERTKIVIQAMRGAYFAPLSRRGRAFTAYLTWDSRATKRVMKQALLDPNKMSKIAELYKNNRWTRQFFEKSAALGLYGDTTSAYGKVKEYTDLTGEQN